jgi:hypothetical protein
MTPVPQSRWPSLSMDVTLAGKEVLRLCAGGGVWSESVRDISGMEAEHPL